MFRNMAQFGRALDLGSRGRRFKSCYSDLCDNSVIKVCQHSEKRGIRVKNIFDRVCWTLLFNSDVRQEDTKY